MKMNLVLRYFTHPFCFSVMSDNFLSVLINASPQT